jgi:hypothetical protein
MKSRIISWAGQVTRMGKRRGACGVWWGNLWEGDHLEDPGLDEKIILRWIFRKWDVGNRLDRAGSG